MKITPLEIRQKTFEKKMRGFDKDEVTAYLTSLSQEWERLMTENKEQRIKIESLERDVQKLRDVESSLFKTLKTAEDTSSTMVEQAKADSVLHLKEAHINAEALINEARQQARVMIDDAEEIVRESLGSVKDQIKELELEYKQIENLKDHLLLELKTIALETVEKVERTEKRYKGFQPIKVPSSDEIIHPSAGINNITSTLIEDKEDVIAPLQVDKSTGEDELPVEESNPDVTNVIEKDIPDSREISFEIESPSFEMKPLEELPAEEQKKEDNPHITEEIKGDDEFKPTSNGGSFFDNL